MKHINRHEYLNWMIRWKEQQIIKVVSGVRRCGKSTLFAIYQEYLLANGVSDEQIININFENIDYEHLSNYKLLYQYVKSLLLPDKINYVFLDEIQHVESFEKAVDSLFIKSNVDVYITGSNAYFMSGELATLLSGRYVELKMLPLSFKEFCDDANESITGLSNAEKFNRYLEAGSFPYTIRFQHDDDYIREYLRDIYHSILLKDIVARLKIPDVMMLESVAKFVFHNIGNRLSATKIANTMKSQGRSIDPKTVEKYIRGLTDSLILYEAGRYNIKGKQFLSTQNKYYIVDIALRRQLIGGKVSDIGHILENIVYLELIRRGYDVYIGQIDDNEVDFVALKGNNITYYQVSASTLLEDTLIRELKPLQKINDNYPKYLLTLDEVFKEVNYDGIQKMNVIDWLLG